MPTNEMTEGGGLNRVLSSAFGVQGPAAPFMATEVFPVLVLGNDRPEWHFLADERLSSGRRNDGASVGNYSHVGLKVAAELGTIAVVERIRITGGGSWEIRIGRSAASDAAGKGYFCDTRFAVGNQPSADLFDRTQATQQGNLLERIAVAASLDQLVTGPWVLHPDSFIVVTSTAVNTGVDASFYWREYRATDGELRGV